MDTPPQNAQCGIRGTPKPTPPCSMQKKQNTNLEILYGGCTECLEEGKLQEEVNKGTFDASTAEEQQYEDSQGNVLARRATCKDLTRQGLL